MGTNFMWIQKEKVKEPKKWEKQLSEVLQKNNPEEVAKFIKENIYEIKTQEEDTDKESDDDNPKHHIGKRSAAGLYCWTCDDTLCKGGKNDIHKGKSEWDKSCPSCGTIHIKNEDKNNSGLMELGFVKAKESRPTGVQSCSSFTWAQDPNKVKDECENNLDKKIIRDEYNGQYTGQEFLDMLKNNCPIEFENLVGQWFS